MSNGMYVKTTVEFNWYEVGQHLASLNDFDQADFLAGFSQYLYDLGAIEGLYQISYMADKSKTGGYVDWFAQELNAAMNEEAK